MDETMFFTPQGKKLTWVQVVKRLARKKPGQPRLPGIDPLCLPAGGSLFGDTTGQQTPNLLSSSPEVKTDAP